MKAVVVGAGAAGTAAALCLAEGGAEVSVIDGARGATALCSGAWDVASASSGSPLADVALADRLRTFAEARPWHPYARVEAVVEAVGRAHCAVLNALGAYRPLDLDSPGVRIATDHGVIRRVATLEESILDLDQAPGGLVAVAHFRGHRASDGAALARALGDDPGADGLSFVDIPVEFLARKTDVQLGGHEIALLGDTADARRRLAAVLRRAFPGSTPHAWLLPPVLGMDHDDPAALLREGVGSPLGEVAETTGGAQGARLTRRLAASRAAADVTDVVARASAIDGSSVALSDGNRLDADVIILATGSALAGGLVASGGVLVEPITRTPVTLESFGTLTAPGPAFASGITVDDEFRMLHEDGRRVGDGVFACGAILAGVSHADGTGLGASVTTGWLAAESALAG
ncbi:MAG: FAD-binding protein [Deltaproteobacteria bacterium]|nr:FAD-binding protein [Deltaproteobacteria bacterium]